MKLSAVFLIKNIWRNLKSSTDKKFKITVNGSGALSAVQY